MTHWNIADVPCGPAVTDSPTAGQWHHLAYTYDGSNAHVFVDGIQKNQKNVNLETKAGFTINLAAQREGAGFVLHAGLAMAIVRVHDGELSAGEIKSNYDNELPRFQ